MSPEELMDRYKRGDTAAFNRLFKLFSSRIYGYLSKSLTPEETDDVFQACFLKVHKQRQKYDSKKLPFEAWLFTICKSCLIDKTRQLKRVADGYVAYGNRTPQGNETRDIEIDLGQLSDKQQKAIRLRYYEDLDFDEIAAILSTSTLNSRKIVSRAIQRLRKIIPP